jgi:hypothetical protein
MVSGHQPIDDHVSRMVANSPRGAVIWVLSLTVTNWMVITPGLLAGKVNCSTGGP